MTYLQILNIIKDTALAQPNVNTVVREFIDLNREDTEYSAVVIQDRDGLRDRISEQDYITYTWHLGYVDRLTYDDGNRDDIFSTGINVINNIVNSIRNTYFPQLEVRVIDRFNTFNQRFTASCAGVYVVLAIDVPVSDCVDGEQTDMYDKFSARITENGHYHFIPDGRPVDEINLEINVIDKEKAEEKLVETITSNGSFHFYPSPDYVFSDAEITVAVSGTGPKEEEELIAAITSNGSYSFFPSQDKVFSDASIAVDVHPSERLVRRYTTNGVKEITGEFNGGTVTVSVPEKEEEELIENIWFSPNMETYDYYPSEGKVFSAVHISYYPGASNDIEDTITENGQYNWSTGGGIDYITSVSINVSVPQKQEVHLSPAPITSNGSYSFIPEEGQVYDAVSISVSVPLQQTEVYDTTITENGAYDVYPSPGYLFSKLSFDVNVHPSSSLVETITSNGTTRLSGEWKDAEITVAVPSVSVSRLSQTAYNNLSVKDPNTIYLIYY